MNRIMFFLHSLGLQLRVVKKRIPALLAMVLAALILSAAAAIAGNALFAGKGFAGITVAAAFEDDDQELTLLMGIVASTPSLASYVNVQLVSPDEALDMLKSGNAAVAAIFPKGFILSVLQGENLSPTIYLNSANRLENTLVLLLSQNITRMLARAQQGIALTLHVHEATQTTNPSRSTTVKDINIEYINFVLASKNMFNKEVVSPTGMLTLAQHYLLSSLLFFTALATPLLFRLYSLRVQHGWVQRLRSAGQPLWVYSMAQIAAGAAALFVLLGLLAGGMAATSGLAPRLIVLPGMLLVALCLSCFGFLCCNAGNILGAVSINFLLSMAMLVIAGGLIPQILLPAALAALTPFSPFTWMLGALAPLFGVNAGPQALLQTTALAALLILAVQLVAWRTEKGGAV